MQKSGAVAANFGLDLDHLNGIVTAIGATTMESGSVIGNSIKSILPNLMMSEKGVAALDSIGIKVKENNGDMRQAQDVLWELGGRWEELNAEQQQNISLAIGGKYHLTRISAAMNNFDLAVKATNDSMNSHNSAIRENDRYQQSLEARMNRLKNAFTELSQKIGESILVDALIVTVEALKSFMSVVGNISQTIGTLPTVLGIVGLAMLAYKVKTMGAVEATRSFWQSLVNLPATIERANSAIRNMPSKVVSISTEIVGKELPTQPIAPVAKTNNVSNVMSTNAAATRVQTVAQKELDSVMKNSVGTVNTLSNGMRTYGTNINAVTKVTEIGTRTQLSSIEALRNQSQSIKEVATVTATTAQNTQKSMATQTVALNGMGTAATRTGMAFRTLGIVAGAGLSMLGSIVLPTAAFMLLGFAIEKAVSRMAEAKRKAEELKKANDATVKTYQESGREIYQLVARYEELTRVMNSGGIQADNQEYIDVQNRLNQLMPQMTQEIDAQGNAHLRSVEAVKTELGFAEDLVTTYRNMASIDYSDSINQLVNGYEEARKKYQQLQSLIDNGAKVRTGTGNGISDAITSGLMKMFSGSSGMKLTNEGVVRAQREMIVLQQEMKRQLMSSETSIADYNRALMESEGTYQALGKSGQSLVKSYVSQQLAAVDVTKKNFDLEKSIAQVQEKALTFAQSIAKVPQEIESAFNGVEFEEIITDEQINAVKEISDAMKNGSIAVGDWKKALLDAGFSAKEAETIIKNLTNAHKDQKAASTDSAIATSNLSDATAENTDLTDANTEALIGNIDAKKESISMAQLLYGVQKEEISAIDQAIGVVATLGNVHNKSAEQVAAYNDAVQILEQYFPQYRGQIGQNIGAILAEIETLKTLGSTSGTEAAKMVQSGEDATVHIQSQAARRSEAYRSAASAVGAETSALNVLRENAKTPITVRKLTITENIIKTSIEQQQSYSEPFYSKPNYGLPAPSGQNFAADTQRSFSVLSPYTSSQPVNVTSSARMFGGSSASGGNTELRMLTAPKTPKNYKSPLGTVSNINFFDQMPLGSNYEMELDKSQKIVAVLEAYMKRLNEHGSNYRGNMMLITKEQQNQLRLATTERELSKRRVDATYRELESRKNIKNMNADQKKALEELAQNYSNELKHLRDINVTIEDLTSSISDMKKQIAINEFDAMIEKADLAWAKMKRNFKSDPDYMLQLNEFNEGDGATKETVNLNIVRINHLEKQKKLVSETIAYLKQQQKVYKDNPVILQEVNTRLDQQQASWKDITLEILSAQKTINDVKKEVSSGATDAMRTYLEQQRDMELEHINTVRTAQEKAHEEYMNELDEQSQAIDEAYEKKRKELSEQKDKEDFDLEMGDLNTQRQELMDKISILSLDNSLSGKAKKADLEEQLADLNKDIESRLRDKEYEDRQKAIDEAQESEQKAIEEKRKAEEEYNEEYIKNLEEQMTAIEQKYKLILENEQYWKQLDEKFVGGDTKVIETELQKMLNLLKLNEDGTVFDDIKDKYSDTLGEAEEFINTLQKNMTEMHDLIKNNLTDALKEALDAVKELEESNADKISSTDPVTPTNPSDSSKTFAATRMRTFGSSDSKTMGIIPANANVRTLSAEGDWVQVEYNGKIGYISRNMIEQQTSSSLFNGGLSMPKLNGMKISQPISNIVAKIKEYIPSIPQLLNLSGATSGGTGDINIYIDNVNANDKTEVENMAETIKRKLQREGKL